MPDCSECGEYVGWNDAEQCPNCGSVYCDNCYDHHACVTEAE